jgi:hypothetical protein
MTRQIKWTQKMRLDLYKRLRERFGAHEKWHAPHQPTRNGSDFGKFLDELVNSFLRDYKVRFTHSAITNQIDWATKRQETVKNSRLLCNWLLNRAAAIEVRFIERSSVPSSATFKYE